MNLSKVIYINYEDYSTLLDGGTITKDGQSYTFDSSALYIIREMPIEHATTATYAERAGLASSADSAINDAEGNSITGTYGKKPLIIEANESDAGTTLKQGTYDSITQALAQNRQVILKLTCDNNDDEICYLPLLIDYTKSYDGYYFRVLRDINISYEANINSHDEIYFSRHTSANDDIVVHKVRTETITGNKTFTGEVSLGSNATATTPTTTDNDTSIATTAFVHNVVNAIPSTEQVQADWNQTTTTAKDYIKNKPDAITNSEIDVIWNEAFGNLITFTVGNTSYQAVKGMTWEQFVGSNYDTTNGGFHIMDSYVHLSDYLLQYSSVIKINNITYMGSVNSQDPIFTEEYNLQASGGASD